MSFTTIFLFVSLLAPINCKLEFVVGIWRHGDRAPDGLAYPKDSHGEEMWPRGWDQLTNRGINEVYNLGKWLRQRYVENEDDDYRILSKQFNRTEIRFESSRSDRAIESAMVVTAGLFPAEGIYKWSEDNGISAWQPIPVHTIYEDAIMRPSKIHCPAYKDIVKSEKKMMLQSLNERFGALFDVLEGHTGHPMIDGHNVDDLYDITRQISNGLKVPSWLNETFDGVPLIEHIIELKRIIQHSKYNSAEKAKFRGGYLLNNWIEKLENVVTGEVKEKAVFYSGHDGTLTALLAAFGVHDGQLVKTSSIILAELHKEEDDYFVNLIFRNGQNKEQLLRLYQCAEDCPLDSFLSITERTRVRTLDELKHICTIAKSSAFASLFTASIALVLAMFL